jgi:hypothetical protein
MGRGMTKLLSVMQERSRFDAARWPARSISPMHPVARQSASKGAFSIDQMEAHLAFKIVISIAIARDKIIGPVVSVSS